MEEMPLFSLPEGMLIDQIPEREAETSATWMRQHPDLMVVSRDRGGAYALVQQFAQMLRTRTGEHLDAWLAQEESSTLASTPVLCRWSRERQRCRESWSHLVDQ